MPFQRRSKHSSETGGSKRIKVNDAEDAEGAENRHGQGHRILEPRVRYGKTEYLVLEAGQDEATWMTEDAVKSLGCSRLLREFKLSFVGYQKGERENHVRRKDRNRNAKPETKDIGKALTVTNDQHEPSSEESQDNTNTKFRTPLQIPMNRGPSGFARNLEPQKILGATDAAGEIMFLMKWFDCDEVDLVPAREANKKCPQVVITFYEGRLVPQFHFENGSQEEFED